MRYSHPTRKPEQKEARSPSKLKRLISPQRLQSLTALQFKRPCCLHLFNIRKEPPLRVLDHTLAHINLRLAFVPQFRDILHFHALIQLAEFPRAVVRDIGRDNKVIDIEFRSCTMHGVRRYCGIEAVRRTGGDAARLGEERREERKDKKENEREKSLEESPGGWDVCI